jgi:hypothetical protein
MEIIIVSPECRRRDNLLSMLESFLPSSSIKMVEVCDDVKKIVNPSGSTIVFIDYREQDKFTEKEISSLIMNNIAEYVILLVSHNAPSSHFTHYSSSELVYDEISIEMLKNLLKNILISVE